MSIAYCPPYKPPNNTCFPNLCCNMSQLMSTSKLLEHTFQVQCSRVLHIIFFTIRISKKTKFVVTHWNHQTVQQLQSLITMTWTRQPTTTLIFYSPKIAWLKVSIARNHKSSLMSSYLATKFERPPTASSESSIPQQSKVTTLVKHIRYIITPGPQQFTTTMFSNDIGYETW